jgi:hypothetical protein
MKASQKDPIQVMIPVSREGYKRSMNLARMKVAATDQNTQIYAVFHPDEEGIAWRPLVKI